MRQERPTSTEPENNRPKTTDKSTQSTYQGQLAHLAKELSRLSKQVDQLKSGQDRLQKQFLIEFEDKLDSHFNNQSMYRTVNDVIFGGRSYKIIEECIRSYFGSDSEDENVNGIDHNHGIIGLKKKKITSIIKKLLVLDSHNTNLKTKHAYICIFYKSLHDIACQYHSKNSSTTNNDYLLKVKKDFELLISDTKEDIHKQFVAIIKEFSGKKVPIHIAYTIFSYQLLLYQSIKTNDEQGYDDTDLGDYIMEYNTLLKLTELTMDTDLEELTARFKTTLLMNIHIYLDYFIRPEDEDAFSPFLQSYFNWRTEEGANGYQDNNNFYLYKRSLNKKKSPPTTSGNRNSFIAAASTKKSSKSGAGNNTSTFKGEIPEWIKSFFDSIGTTKITQSERANHNLKLKFSCKEDAKKVFKWLKKNIKHCLIPNIESIDGKNFMIAYTYHDNLRIFYSHFDSIKEYLFEDGNQPNLNYNALIQWNLSKEYSSSFTEINIGSLTPSQSSIESSSSDTGNNTSTFEDKTSAVKIPAWMEPVFTSIDAKILTASDDKKNIKVKFTHDEDCASNAQSVFNWIGNLADGKMKKGEIMIEWGNPYFVFSRDRYNSLQKYLLNKEDKPSMMDFNKICEWMGEVEEDNTLEVTLENSLSVSSTTKPMTFGSMR